MSEVLEKITKGESYTGQACVYCGERIQAEDEVVVCPRCKSVHHADCWKKNGGCGKQGCAQIAKAVVGESSKGAGPPPPMSRRTILAIAGAFILIVAAFLFWPKPPDPAMGRTKVVFVTETGYEMYEMIADEVAAFNSSQEEIYLEMELLPVGTSRSKLIVLIGANHPPDIMAVDNEMYEQFLEADMILPIDVDESGEPVYYLDNPASPTKIVIWGQTEHPEEAREVVKYLVPRFPQPLRRAN